MTTQGRWITKRDKLREHEALDFRAPMIRDQADTQAVRPAFVVFRFLLAVRT